MKERHKTNKQIPDNLPDIFYYPYLIDLLDHSKDIIVYISDDKRRTIKYVCGSISALGYHAEDFIHGKYTVSCLIDPDNLLSMVNHEKKELSIRKKDGNFVRSSIVVIPLVEKDRSGFLMKINNIRDEPKILENRKILQTIFDHSVDGIVLIDTNGLVIEWNKGYEQITGIASSDAIGTLYWDLVLQTLPEEEKSSERITILHDGLDEIIRNQETYTMEHCFVHMITKEKRTLHVQYFPVPVPGRSVTAMISRDITDEVRSKKIIVQNEQKLLENNALLNGIMQTLPTPLFVKDVHGKYIECNEAFLNMFGFTRKQVIGNNSTQLFPQMKDEIDRTDYELHASNKTMRLESKMRNVNSIVEGIIYRNMIRDENGIPKGIVGVVLDISELKKTERNLTIERDRLKNISDNFPNGVLFRLELDLSTEKISISHLSKTWEKITHLSVEKSLSNPSRIYVCIHTEDRSRLMEGIDESISTLRHFEMEFRFLCGKEIRWLQLSTYPHFEGNKVFSDGFILDITDRKRAEEALSRSEKMYRQLILASPDAIVVCDSKTALIYISEKARKLLKISTTADIQELYLLRYIHTHDRKRMFELFNRSIHGEEVSPCQMLLTPGNSGEFFGEISLSPVKIDKDEVTSVIIIIRDISEQKRNEMELICAKEKAEESDRLKSAFLSNMSHEILTPVNAINGFLDIMDHENMPQHCWKEYIKIIKNNCRQLTGLMEDIIEIAKIEAGQIDISPLPIQLNEFMQEVYLHFDGYMHSNHLDDKVTLILDDSRFIHDCCICADPVRLKQVLSRLIENAIKFTEKGYIRFGYQQTNFNMLEFFVEDTGIGIEKSHQELIFERFRQVQENNNRPYGGAGLGLSISKSLVQKMGGDMRVTSVINNGSVFYFTISYLPVLREDRSLFELKGEDQTNQRDKHISVLLVEPEIMRFKYYESLLSHTGISLLHACDTRQWFEQINRTEHIDFVMVNINVLHNENYESIRKVKSVRPSMPLVLIAQESYPENNDPLIKLCKCDMVLQEPVSSSDLNQVLESFNYLS